MNNPFEQLLGWKSEEQQLAARLEKLLQSEERSDREIDAILDQLRLKYPNTYKAFVIEDARVQTGRLNGEIIEIRGRDGRVKQILVKRNAPVYVPRNPQERERNPNGRGRTPIQVADASKTPIDPAYQYMVEQRKEKLTIPQTLISNPTIKKELQRYWTLQWDQLIFENSHVEKKLRDFIQVLNRIYDIPRNPTTAEVLPQGKVQLVKDYVFLVNEGSEFVTPDLRTMLTYRIAEAIYDDIIRAGWIVEREWAGSEYVIKNIKTGKTISSPYSAVFTQANARNLFDVIRVASMVKKDFRMNNGIITEPTLINQILEDQNITGPDGKNIVEARLLLIHKDHVLEKINGKLKDSKITHDSYQKLTFLKEYLTGNGTSRENYITNVLQNVNEYQQFVKDKAIIWGWQGKDLASMTEKDYADYAADMIKQNPGSFVIMGIIAWIMWYKKAALGAFWLGLFGTPLADGAIALKNQGKKLSKTELGIINPDKIEQTLNRSEYQDKFSTLVTKNNENIKKQWYDDKGRAIPSLPNDTLFNIVNDVTTLQINVDVLDDTSKTVSTLKTELDGKWKTYSTEDLTKFINLLKTSSIKEDSDKKLLDYFASGVDNLNKPLEVLRFTEEPAIDDQLNKTFKAKYDSTDGTGKKKILETRQKVFELLRGNTLTKIFEDAKKSVWMGRDIWTSLSNIDSYLQQNYPEIKDDVMKTLKTYKSFAEAKQKVERFRGVFWEQNKDKLLKTVYNLLDFTWALSTDADKVKLSRAIGDNINSLSSIKANIKESWEPFGSLKREIDDLIANFNRVQRDLSNTENSLLWIPAMTTSSFVDQFNYSPEQLAQNAKMYTSVLDNFITKKDINDVNSLKKVQIALKALEDYKSFSQGLVVNKNDLPGKAQDSILRTLGNNGEYEQKKAQIENFIKTELNKKATDYTANLSKVQNISFTTGNTETNLRTIREVQDFVGLQQWGNGSTLQSALNTVQQTSQSLWIQETWNDFWGAISAGAQTWAYAIWIDGYLSNLANKYNELRGQGRNVTDAQQAFEALKKTIEDTKNIDKQNEEVFTTAKEILWPSLTVTIPGLGNTISLPRMTSIPKLSDIQSEIIKKLLEGERAVESELQLQKYKIDVLPTVPRDKIKDEIKRVQKVASLFPNNTTIKQNVWEFNLTNASGIIKELSVKYLDSTKLSEPEVEEVKKSFESSEQLKRVVKYLTPTVLNNMTLGQIDNKLEDITRRWEIIEAPDKKLSRDDVKPFLEAVIKTLSR